MKISHITGIAAALLLTGCMQDEVLNVNLEGDAISVGASTQAASRASNAFCNDNMPENFYLSAVFPKTNTFNDGRYFVNDYMSGGKTAVQTNTTRPDHQRSNFNYNFVGSSRYWPEGNLDFYGWYTNDPYYPTTNFELMDSLTHEAYVNGLYAFDPVIDTTENTRRPESRGELLSSGSSVNRGDSILNNMPDFADETYVAVLKNFYVNEYVAQQHDLLYASSLNVENRTTVNVQFEHALAQVVFRAKVENEHISVSIKEVGFDSLYSGGDFICPDPQVYKYWYENAENISSAESQIRDTDMGDQMQSNRRRINRAGDDAAGLTISEKFKPFHNLYKRGWFLNSNQTPDARYLVSTNGTLIDHKSGEIILTGAPDKHSDVDGWAKVLQVMPQFAYRQAHQEIISQTDPSLLGARRRMTVQHNVKAMSGLHIPTLPAGKQAYLIMSCDIKGTTADGKEVVFCSSTDENGETRYIRIPVSISWYPGIRYVYTITFSKDGFGGLTDDPTPGQVLCPIRVIGNTSDYSDENQSAGNVAAQGVLSVLG
ncbi:MAG: hypothetical protein NC301_08045 [Bacteroides sp.]|nr:hypothetical protein [Bacteroides sp.]MCM1379448.1 hypothetical protein [Bacteroides sp.]MCM1445309.1 hypothetical protein [Prevotella sp.]